MKPASVLTAKTVIRNTVSGRAFGEVYVIVSVFIEAVSISSLNISRTTK
jgi:hypothetical protein